ncbi:hypothetical protein MTR67_041934 [Solanum verrucosum]|uniref:Uncharacterized protein n=1 Tax=Solanum verrucosum TaxID=315347 RepID=A0AAF0UMB9_SOLVR|nr:hypothetical protein MTR67_041934 [Solanum verrucosum]
MEKLRYLEIVEAEFDKQPEAIKEYLFGDDYAESFCLTLENLTQLQILHLSIESPTVLSRSQLPSNLKKLVLFETVSVISFIAELPNLEYLYIERACFIKNELCLSQSEEWCHEDITFHKLKFLKLLKLDISRLNASEESFPLLETLVIKKCRDLEEIPLSFAYIPTMKQIKLIRCRNESLEASAERIKEEAETIEGCDCIDLIIKESVVKSKADVNQACACNHWQLIRQPQTDRVDGS